MGKEKVAVRDFWDKASCGEALYLSGFDEGAYDKQAELRYRLEPFILAFAEFPNYKGRRVLEIGVGLGADHQRFAEAGAILTGVDLTGRAIEHCRRRFQLLRLNSDLQVADAEDLPFPDESFDLVYSWGVLHHSPDTPKAIAEVWRVPKKSGHAKIMIYHKWSMVGVMLWMRYALLRLRPFASLKKIYAHYLESPGTKAYSVGEAKRLFEKFSGIRIKTVLTHGDLLSSGAGQRHQGAILSIARRIWPRLVHSLIFPESGPVHVDRREEVVG